MFANLRKLSAGLILAASLWIPPAFADSIWAITRNGAQVATVTLTDAQQSRIASWAVGSRRAAVVQTPAVPAVIDANGAVTTPEVPAVMRDPTNAEAIQFLASGFFADMFARATSWHRDNAAKDAANAVAPIEPK